MKSVKKSRKSKTRSFRSGPGLKGFSTFSYGFWAGFYQIISVYGIWARGIVWNWCLKFDSFIHVLRYIGIVDVGIFDPAPFWGDLCYKLEYFEILIATYFCIVYDGNDSYFPGSNVAHNHEEYDPFEISKFLKFLAFLYVRVILIHLGCCIWTGNGCFWCFHWENFQNAYAAEERNLQPLPDGRERLQRRLKFSFFRLVLNCNWLSWRKTLGTIFSMIQRFIFD